MHRLDRVGGIDHLANIGGKGKERNDMLPGSPPSLADCRVALAPYGLELLEMKERHLGVLGAVDRLDGGQDRRPVSPGYERQTVSDEMHDTRLDDRLRIHRGDGLGKTLEAVDYCDEDVVDAVGFQLIDHPKPELCSLRLLDP